MYETLLRIAAGLGLFLIGVNMAFLFNLGARLVRWFTFKILGVTAMLFYMVLSLTYGHPSGWRTSIGLGAMAFDLLAVGWMWYSVTSLRDREIVGLVPIIRPEED